MAAAAAGVLLWPTALNWHPYLFWDTYGYFLQGKAYTKLLLAAAGLGPMPLEAAEGWIGAAGRMLASDPSIRSPTYSLLLYALAAAGGFWLVAAAQALAAAVTVEVAMCRLLRLPAPGRLVLFLLLAVGTALPWFASYLMPDLAAGLLILAAATIAFAWPSLRHWERVWLGTTYLLAASFHSSHLLLGGGLAVLAWLLADRGAGLRLLLPVVAAFAVLTSVGWLGFGTATPTPRAPPFLLARSWEDGPARAYLEAACGRGERWAICDGLATLAPSAQGLLWNPEHSYWAMDLPTRAVVRAEEGPLLRRALAAYPLAQLEASARNALRQLARFGLDDLVLGRGAAVTPEDYTFVYLPAAPAAVWGLAPFSALSYAATTLALLVLAARSLRRPAAALALLVLAGIVLNAAICGVLSGPHDRYQARVIWLVPLLAAGLAWRRAPELSAAPRAPAPAAP